MEMERGICPIAVLYFYSSRATFLDPVKNQSPKVKTF